jgi:copper chaperone CopZ
MKRLSQFVKFKLAVLFVCLATAMAESDHAASSMTIYVRDMHCANCAKRIARKLYTVPGVVKVQTDVPSATAIVTPQRDRHPSPRALWEAVEKAEFKPVKLVTPAGTFTAKPRR